MPEYVGRSKRIQEDDRNRRAGQLTEDLKKALAVAGTSADNTSFGSYRPVESIT